jgi:hypothetical protein
MELDREEVQVYSKLSRIATWREGEMEEVAGWVLQRKICLPHEWFYLLVYILEREPSSLGRGRVVRIISDVVLGERSRRVRPFTDLVKENITSISHASDTPGSREVRIFLHQCVYRWIEAGIVSAQFLKSLEQEEAKWSGRGPRPSYSYPASTEAPVPFDLVRLGLQGPGYNRTLDMRKLVEQGMADKSNEGWLSRDKYGHFVVHVKE